MVKFGAGTRYRGLMHIPARSQRLLRSQTQIAHVFHQALQRWLWRQAHSSIGIHEGERHPHIIFRITIDMLGFNDPYVRERMLAASYGVLMRSWAFANPRLRNRASEFARALYDAMFRPQAPQATKHILARDYGLGAIELARKLDSRCLGSRRLDRITPPFPRTASPIPSAHSIPEKDCKDADRAIHMDFENYTVGRLVESRGPYDFKHKEYRGVLRQIKWRVLNLGYSKRKFEQIDRRIGEESFIRGRNANGEKIDRYGKKYSWIAFFEMCGIRADRRVLPYFDEEGRVGDCDIDPSFPETPRQWKPPLKPIFNRSFRSPIQWARDGGSPRYDQLLVCKEVGGISGPWVLLHGFVQEAAITDSREIFTFARGFLVRGSDVRRLRAKLNAIEYPGNQAIPEPSTDHYTFAGEIPWSCKFGRYYRRKNCRAVACIGEAFEGHRYRMIRKGMNDLNAEELRQLAFQRNQSGVIKRLLKKTKERRGGSDEDSSHKDPANYVELNQYEKIPGVRVEIPVLTYAWGSDRSTENKVGSVDYAAPALCDALKLRNKGGSVDLYDDNGRPATIYCVFGTGSDIARSDLLYIRKDLLKRYLSRTKQKIAWILWGERSFNYTQIDRLRSQLEPVWANHGHIHRTMIVRRLH